jgi:probable rRNA maturation factor
MKPAVEVNRNVKKLGHPETAGLIRKAVEKALQAEGVLEPCTVSVLLTDEEGIRTLNREYRKIDRVTDVLSFPMNELTPGAFRSEKCERDPQSGNLLLGDMALCLPRCQEQAEELHHSYAREVSYLTVHSVLHLLGYDHTDEGPQKRQMRAREKAIMGEDK